MRQGMTLQAMAAELERVREAKRDFIADAQALRFAEAEIPNTPETDVRLEIGGDLMPLEDHAHGQMAGYLGIPKAYYDRMRTDAPDLLTTSLNRWLGDETGGRLVRTLDGSVRGVLSDRYRCLDNADLAEAVLPALMQSGAEVVSCAITPQKFFVKAIVPGLSAELFTADEYGRGDDRVDTVQGGLVISNSEVGCGALAISPAIHRVACTNLSVFNENAMRRTHVGRREDRGDETIREFLTSETRRLEDAAIWAKARDLTAAALDGRIFERYVAELRAARGDTFDAGAAEQIVEVVAERLDLQNGERASVLGHLIAGGDLSRYGLHNAVTRAAHLDDPKHADDENTSEAASYERASDLERAGGRLIELEATDWKAIVAQAS